ncbi:hypothetical protein NKDENANG_03978 [Candidatus Entotheonellaceae bacterium PAL068K]
MDGDIATVGKQQAAAVLRFEQRHTGAGFRRAPAFGGNASGPACARGSARRARSSGMVTSKTPVCCLIGILAKSSGRCRKKIAAQQFEILNDPIGISFWHDRDAAARAVVAPGGFSVEQDEVDARLHQKIGQGSADNAAPCNDDVAAVSML